MAKVSIVIPAFDGDRFISETLESVLAQTYQDFEVIVIDDGSKDNTSAIVKDFISKYPGKIRYLYQENKGVAAARNRGIKESLCELIAFIDQDDLWMPEKLKKSIRYLEENREVGMVYNKADRFGLLAASANNAYCEGNIFLKLLKNDFDIPTCSAVIRREVFVSTGFFDEDPELAGSDDYDMWLRISHRYKIGYINEALSLWRVHSGGYSYSHFESMIKARLKVFKKNIHLLDNTDIDTSNLAKHYYARNYAELGNHFFSKNDFYKARVNLIKSFVCRPVYYRKSFILWVLTFFPSGVVSLIRNTWHNIRMFV